MEDDATIAGTIDVVIPMRNGRATIQQTLDSVTAQTLLPRRIIVVDDGSTDGGAELLRGHPLIDVIATPPRGVSHARNTGIKASRAEFIAFLDCDDLWRADKLERQLAVARRVPQAALITCDHLSRTPDGRVIPLSEVRPRFHGHAFDQVLATGFALGGWSSSMLVRRDAVLQAGGYDETLAFGEDMELSFRLAHRHWIENCPELLVYVVENPHSTIRSLVSHARIRELCLQYLTVMERWGLDGSGDVARNKRVARQSARFILSRAVYHGLGLTQLAALRRDMPGRTPGLAARIARSDTHLLASLVKAGVLDFGEAAVSLRRIAVRRRYLARSAPKAVVVLAPRAETSA